MKQEAIIKQLRKGDPKAISLLYEYFPIVKNYILKNSGLVSDAEDVFQESLIILYKKILNNSFQLNSKIETYVFGISKNLWFEELRKRNKTNTNVLDINFEIDETIKNHFKEEKQYQKIDSILKNIGEKCKQILQLFYYKNKTMQEIAYKLNYKNVNTVKTQKYKCLERAKKMAQEINVNLQNRAK